MNNTGRQHKIKTWKIEATVALIILLASSNLGTSLLEYIAVLAVFISFLHNQVADRLREKEAYLAATGLQVSVECYRLETFYFIIKEILWFIYFILLGLKTSSWAGLTGVFIFLGYRFWRPFYRKYKPITRR